MFRVCCDWDGVTLRSRIADLFGASKQSKFTICGYTGIKNGHDAYGGSFWGILFYYVGIFWNHHYDLDSRKEDSKYHFTGLRIYWGDPAISGEESGWTKSLELGLLRKENRKVFRRSE